MAVPVSKNDRKRYVLKADREKAPEDQSAFVYRNPTDAELTRITSLVAIEGGGATLAYSSSLVAFKTLMTDVENFHEADGTPIEFERDGKMPSLRFLGRISSSDQIEIGSHILMELLGGREEEAEDLEKS